MPEHSSWVEIIERDPNHSTWYIERFRSKAAAGEDLAGEARLINAMVGRGARILDAGCGPGRVGAFLADFGHEVVGVDVDPALIAAAEEDHPGPIWLVGDLSDLDLPSRGITEGFDAIVAAGNVLPFVAADRRREALTRLARHLRPDGRLVVGFGNGRGYGFDQFFDDAEQAGLVSELKLATWDLRPLTADSGFVVAVFGR